MRMLTQRKQLLVAMDGHEKACEALTDESKGLVSEKLRERLVDSMAKVLVVLAVVREEMSLYAAPTQLSFDDWLSPEDTEPSGPSTATIPQTRTALTTIPGAPSNSRGPQP